MKATAGRWKTRLGKRRHSTHLREGDAVVVAHIHGAAELAGLHQQLHALLMLPMLQKEVSCSIQGSYRLHCWHDNNASGEVQRALL